MAAPKKCSECGAELRLRPRRCPLCGSEVDKGESETNVERYQEGMRDLRKQLKKLRDEAEAV